MTKTQRILYVIAIIGAFLTGPVLVFFFPARLLALDTSIFPFELAGLLCVALSLGVSVWLGRQDQKSVSPVRYIDMSFRDHLGWRRVVFPAGFKLGKYILRDISVTFVSFLPPLVLCMVFVPLAGVPLNIFCLSMVVAFVFGLLVKKVVFTPQTFDVKKVAWGWNRMRMDGYSLWSVLNGKCPGVLEQDTELVTLPRGVHDVMEFAFLSGFIFFYATTYIRPVPLAMPPADLMAKVHPALLDENGNIVKRESVVLNNCNSFNDVANVFSSSNDVPELRVYKSLVSLANDNNKLDQNEYTERVKSLVAFSKTCSDPQLPLNAALPASLAEWKDYATVWNDGGIEFISCVRWAKDVLAASRNSDDVESFPVAVSNVTGLVSAMLSVNPASKLHIIGMTIRKCELQNIIRYAAEANIAAGNCQSAGEAFSLDGKRFSDRILRAELDDMPSGIMALLINPQKNEEERYSFNHLSSALRHPFFAFLSGYDIEAQKAAMDGRRAWLAVRLCAAYSKEAGSEEIRAKFFDLRKEALKKRSPCCRGGLFWGIDELLFNRRMPSFDPFFCQALYADQYGRVADTALRLAQFRAQEGRDAANLDEVKKTLGWTGPEDDSSDIYVRYDVISAPEGAADGTFAYAITMVPKDEHALCLKNTAMSCLVIRNKKTDGTTENHMLCYECFMGDERELGFSGKFIVSSDSVKDNHGGDFIIPANLFSDDADKVAKAISELNAAGWDLK